MFCEQVIVLCNIFIVEIRYSEIKNYIEKKGEIEQRKIFSVFLITDKVLNVGLNDQYPTRFDEEVEENENKKICDELFLHSFFKGLLR